MDPLRAAQIIGGMMLVTYLPRLVPMFVLAGKKLPWAVERWLSFVPAAVMSALLCAGLAAKPGEAALAGFDVSNTLAALPAGYVAWRCRNILLTVVVGLAAAALLRAVV